MEIVTDKIGSAGRHQALIDISGRKHVFIAADNPRDKNLVGQNLRLRRRAATLEYNLVMHCNPIQPGRWVFQDGRGESRNAEQRGEQGRDQARDKRGGGRDSRDRGGYDERDSRGGSRGGASRGGYDDRQQGGQYGDQYGSDQSYGDGASRGGGSMSRGGYDDRDSRGSGYGSQPESRSGARGGNSRR